MIDYHVHCSASFDCEAAPQAQIDAAIQCGINELCFTDHVDFDYAESNPNAPAIADIALRNAAFDSLDTKGVMVLSGVELGLSDADAATRAVSYLNSIKSVAPMDFIIGSVHQCDGFDCYYPEYFAGKTRAYAYRRYLEQVVASAKCCSMYSVIGHYDFCAKFSPYADRAVRYSDAPELFDELFTYLIENGKGIEVNSGAWRSSDAWGLDIISRYHELGGRIITIGSDAHRPENMGRRLNEAVDLIAAAGFKYITTFRGLTPRFIPIDEVRIG